MKNNTFTFSPAAVRRAIQSKKNKNRIDVQAVNEKECYVSNGYIALLLSRAEHDRLIRPITGQDFGSYRIVGGHLDGIPCDIEKVWSGYQQGFNEKYKDAMYRAFMEDSGVTICENGNALTGLYNSGLNLTVVVNKLYLDVFPGCSFYCAGELQPVFVLKDWIPVGLIMPVKDWAGNVSRAVRSYFVPAQNSQAEEEAAATAREQLEKAENAVNRLSADLEAAQAKIAELEAALAAAKVEAATPTEPATERPSTISKAEAAAALFSDLPGVTVTVKGAQTAAPVLWFSGEVQPHADSLRAKGAKWSVKKSAFYFCA